MEKQIGVALAVGFAAVAWVGYAEHPTARKLRKAVIATVQALLA